MSDFNFERYAIGFTRRVVQGVAAAAANAARRFVRVDTGTLRSSISTDTRASTPFEAEVSAETEYAAAQEYGRPDLPRYGYTPYMRPGAKEANDKIPEIAERAAAAAEKEARI
jgi:hypothetical protein